MEPFDIALRAWILVFAALLFVFAMMAYRRYGGTRLAVILSVFAVFLVKGLVLVLAVLPALRDLNLRVLRDWLRSLRRGLSISLTRPGMR